MRRGSADSDQLLRVMRCTDQHRFILQILNLRATNLKTAEVELAFRLFLNLPHPRLHMTSPEPDSTAPLTLSPLRRALPVAEDSQSKDVMLKSNHRIRPTLFDLPPGKRRCAAMYYRDILLTCAWMDGTELKAIIVEMIYEGTDDDDFADQETVASDGEDDKEDDNAEDQDKDEVKASTLQNMSLVDSTFSQLCFPLLWKHVDFEGKDNIRVACFLDEILPRHGQFDPVSSLGIHFA